MNGNMVILLLVFCFGNTMLAIAATKAPPNCPHDFLGHSDSCYHVARIKATWPESVAYCESFGAELAIVEDEQEQKFLAETLKHVPNGASESYWLGAIDILTEGEWQWAITLERMAYSNWDAGQPDNGHTNEHCLEISGSRGFKWNDDGCENHHFFICETRLW